MQNAESTATSPSALPVAEQRGPASAAPPTDGAGEERALLELVGAVIAEVGDGRGLGRLQLDASFEKDLGLGSLERVELFGRAEATFGVRLPEQALAEAETPRKLLEHIRARREGRKAGAGEGAGAGGGTRGTGEAARVELPSAPPAPPPEKARTLVEVFEYRALRDKDRVHMVLVREDGSEEAVTYGALRREAGAVAEALRGLALAPRAKVAIMLPTGRGYFAAFLGTLLAGGVPVPLYPPFRLDRIAEYIEREARIIENAEASVLITFDRAARVAELTRDRVGTVQHVLSIEAVMAATAKASAAASAYAAEVGPDDTALIQYTSGSTGDPKGVELTHANVLANVRACAAGCALTTQDVMVSWLPLYHDMGLIGGWLMNFFFGNPTVILSPVTFLSRPETWLQAITRHRGTISVSPNFAFELCVRRIAEAELAKLDLSRMRDLLNGSEPIHPATLDRFADRFARAGFKRGAIFCAYGLAENMVGVAFPPPGRGPRVDAIERRAFEHEGRAVPAAADATDALRFVGVGHPLPTNEVRIAGEDGQELPARRQGRLLFRGPSAFKGYYRNPEATAKVKLADGWVESGDLAYKAEDGEVFITGRSKDLIIKGGRNYYPHEIEAAASAVAGVRTGCVAAFALRDEHAGTEMIVVVAETKESDATAREALSAKIGESIATAIGTPPDRVVLAPPGAVPKTSSGKIRRNDTRKLYLSGELGKDHGSFARQAAGLYLGSLPTRAVSLAKRAASAAYGAYAMGTFLTSLGVFTALGHVTPSGRPLRWVAVANARVSLGLTGLLPRLIGAEKIPAGAAVLVANHASYLDPYVFVAALPVDTRFVVKGECRENIFFGSLMRRAGHVMVERHQAERSLDDLRDVCAHLERGERVLIFPEGTFLREVGLRPFKLGAFRVACEAGVPVVPIALRGTRRAYRDGEWWPKRVPIEAEVLDPIQPTGKGIADVVRLRDRAAAAIAARIEEPRMGVVSVDGAAGA